MDCEWSVICRYFVLDWDAKGDLNKSLIFLLFFIVRMYLSGKKEDTRISTYNFPRVNNFVFAPIFYPLSLPNLIGSGGNPFFKNSTT